MENTFSGGVFSETLTGGRAGAEIELAPGGVSARAPGGETFFVPYRECQVEFGGYSGRMVFCRDAERTVTIGSASKAFNVAGLRCAVAHVGSDRLLRALDGRPDQARLLADAATLVAARAEISIIGNAGQFGAATTTIAFHTEQAEDWALALRDALGTGEVVAATSPDNVIDITVTLGQDLQ